MCLLVDFSRRNGTLWMTEGIKKNVLWLIFVGMYKEKRKGDRKTGYAYY